MENIIQQITSLWASLTAVVIIIAAFLINNWIFKRIKKEKDKSTLTRQIISVVIVLIGSLLFTLTLPIDQSLKAQIISLIGIVLSAAFALSSTTLIGNGLAGLMNNSIKNFRLGDYVKIEDNFGRVTKKGLLRTEIQTRDRDLMSLPNLYIASKPVKVIRESGTIISTIVSLGYDLNRSEIENYLLSAAEAAGLTDPFVYIESLGDFSVSYQINGLLSDVDKYFTTKSRLNAQVLDHLHKNGVEIVSPTFMNQRQANETKFIPTITATTKKEETEKSPEELIFDKAIEATKIEEKSAYLKQLDEKIEELQENLKVGGDKTAIGERIERLKDRKGRLAENIEELKKKLSEQK